MTEKYTLIVVGSGFASCFFLNEALRHLPASARVLVLERGAHRDHAWQLKNPDVLPRESAQTFQNANPVEKPWRFTVAVGGSSNCWVGCTPRMLPEDFELKSRYGVGADWPLTYDDLEPFYLEVERMMGISGPDNTALFPRSAPYPQPPHRMQDTEIAWQKIWPGHFFALPTARARVATAKRGACCANHACQLCPVDAKFTILNEMMHVLTDPRATLVTGARVDALEMSGGQVSGVHYRHEGRDNVARADFVALGANAMFNPTIMLNSGIKHAELGRGLGEQVSMRADVKLRDLAGFQGSTYLTGHGYMLYGGAHRRERAAGLIETRNKPELRLERGKFRNVLRLKVIYEDLRLPTNVVTLTADADRPALADWRGHSEYASRSLAALPGELTRILEGMPVEDVDIATRYQATESHVMGTVVMGRDPAESVVDADLRHHALRNLAVLGSSSFPTSPPANPTLTLSALSVRAARHTFAPRGP